MPTIVAMGEMLIDFAPVAADAAGYPTLKAQPGGAPCNFLAALQKSKPPPIAALRPAAS